MLRIEHLDQAPEDFLSDDPEDGRYHRAFQAARVPGFDFGYYVAWDGSTRVAVVPYFLMDFQLNTMLPEGFLKRALGFLKFKVACVGHPSTDLGHMEGKPTHEMLTAINKALREKASLVAYKGFGPDMPLAGFVRVSGLPVALLRIQGDFWSALSSDRRSNLKRKVKKANQLTMVEHEGLTEELALRVHELYLRTYEKAEVKFERLTVDYFTKTAEISKYLLFYDKEELIGFVQLICKRPRMVFRYLGMDYERSNQYGLYFILFLKAIEICVRDGYSEMESGATSYDFKKRLGSDILETWVYYRHSNPLIHWVLGKVKFLLEPTAAELQ